MSWWSFYSNADGTFHRITFSSSNLQAVAMNVPAGYTPIKGIYDATTQKVDFTTNPVTVVPIGS